MQMDVRDMSFFQDESFDCVIDKGTNIYPFFSYFAFFENIMLIYAIFQFLLLKSCIVMVTFVQELWILWW